MPKPADQPHDAPMHQRILPSAPIASAAMRLRMGEVQGQGYIAQALDIADVLAVAYFHAMTLPPGGPGLGGPRPLPAVHRPLRHRALCRADRGRHHPRGRARDLRLRRQPPADVRHGRLHAGHGDLRRLARPRPRHRRRHGASALKRKESEVVRLQPVLRRRARRGLRPGRRPCRPRTTSSTT